MDEMDLVRQLKDVPPLRPEAYERARATLGTKMAAPVRRERFTWLRNLPLPGKIGIGVVGAAVAVAVAFAAAPTPTTTVPTAQGPEVGGRLVALAADVKSSAQVGDASLVIRHRTAPDGSPEVTYNLYTDKGEVYVTDDKRGLSAAIAHHDNLADPMDARVIAAARHAATGDVDKAREEMVNATPNGWGLGLSPAEAEKVWDRSEVERMKLLKEKGVKDAKPRPRPTGKDLQDGIANNLWTNSLDALTRGAANAEVRAGVLRLIATISDVSVMDSKTEGQPSLTLTAGPAVFHGDGAHVLKINAQNGLPFSSEWQPAGKGEPEVEVYKSARVTVADVAAGKF